MNTSLSEVRVAVFDLDGTLSDTQFSMLMSLGLAADRLGFKHDVAHLELLKGLSGNEWLTRAQQVFQASADQLQQLIDARDRYFLKFARSQGVPIRQGAGKLLKAVRAKLGRIAVWTGSPIERAEFVLWTAGLKQHIDHLVTRDDPFPSKPSPEALWGIAEHFEIEPRLCLMVGDGRADIEAAKAAGVCSVYVPTSPQTAHANTIAMADYTYYSLDELWQDFIRSRPE